jgi:adenylate cyclase
MVDLGDLRNHAEGAGAATIGQADRSEILRKAITRTAASSFIEKAAQLGAYHVDEQFKNVRDSLEMLAGLPSIQEAEIEDNSRLYGLMASMLRNNPQLFNLYLGYEDGSFLEMDVIDRAKPGFRASLHVDEDVAFRLVVISRTGNAAPVTCYLVSPMSFRIPAKAKFAYQ